MGATGWQDRDDDLDAAGEIMILYKRKLDEAIKTIRTIDFNVETTSSNERHTHRGQLQLHRHKCRNDEDTYVVVKGVITDLINQLQVEASPEGHHRSCYVEETLHEENMQTYVLPSAASCAVKVRWTTPWRCTGLEYRQG